MTLADSVSVFAEGTFEEQIRELVDYVARSQPENARASFLLPFQEAIKAVEGAKPLDEDKDRQRQVISMVAAEVKGLGVGSEKEIEGFFNLLYAHLLTLFPEDASQTRQLLGDLLRTVSASPSDSVVIKYCILSNLFNAIPRQSSLRLFVYKTLLEIAIANEQLDFLQLSNPQVEKWISEWSVSPDEKSDFLKLLVDVYTKAGYPETSYKYIFPYVRSLPASSPASRAAIIDAIAATLRLPSIFEFDALYKLEGISSARDHELYSLLQIFTDGSLTDFNSWVQSHPRTMDQFDLNRAQLERKIRLLTLSSLGFQYVGQDLSYTEIAEALQVNPAEVEKWAIDVIRTGLVSGKLSQTTQVFHITRAAARAFGRPEWEALEQRLETWKAGLAGVLEVVSAARKKAGNGAVPVEPNPEAQAQVAAA